MVEGKKRTDDQSEEETRDREIWRKGRLMNETNKGERDETEMSHDPSTLTPLVRFLLLLLYR